MITVDDLSLQYSGAPAVFQMEPAVYPRQLLWHHRRQRRRQIHRF